MKKTDVQGEPKGSLGSLGGCMADAIPSVDDISNLEKKKTATQRIH
jgi:hypothetical protein